ncbi:hypothetical protein NQX30_03115 [Candidatus Persebacteraceae bacterium Df01]|uniref:Glycosyltransferase RgtA/B/C/D-like domain-containing protein n=1 Tax=Candidatus Doriopsillibacter californiensis TaxID=2970740 RepID=A0ABT7QLH1_9GAMM|nr:hypothetical protein [Candidatus Persebacteraceae bacterium Df01]
MSYLLKTLSKKDILWATAIFLLSVYLTLFNLDYVTLWHDEGVNAIMARNLINSGTFSTWDGRNLHMIGVGNSNVNENLNVLYSPWPEPPWAVIPSALGMVIFGENEIGVRFFHGILGLVSLLFFWKLLNLDFFASPRLRILAFALFALSAQVILFMRQGRYFADAFLFSLASFYYYRLYISTVGKPRHLILVVGLTILNFLNHFAIGTSTALSFGVWHLLYYRNQTTRQQWLGLFVAGVIVAAVCGFYLLFIGAIGNELGKEGEYVSSWFPRHLRIMGYYLRDTVTYGWLPFWIVWWLIFFVFFRLFFNNRESKRKLENEEASSLRQVTEGIDKRALRWIVLALLNIIAAAIISVQSVAVPSAADSRYLLAALPFLSLSIGFCVEWFWRRKKWLAMSLLAVLLLSNALGYPFLFRSTQTDQGLKWTLPSLIKEIHHPYPTAVEEISIYLRAHAKQDDLIFVSSEPDRVLLHFYLGDKLIFCCLLDSPDELPQSVILEMNKSLYMDNVMPDWIVISGNHSPPKKSSGIELAYISSTGVYPTQRPELEFRSFTPIYDSPRGYIYQRIRP